MTRIAVLASLLLAVWLATVATAHLRVAKSESSPATRADLPAVPVLVELFTSEGCSSCPPADALLRKVDQSQPVHGADMVVLSEHVDYWDDLGWRDPYSSRQFSLRQGDYARSLHTDGPYTPQIVVDGNAQLVGSDERELVKAVANAATANKASVNLSAIQVDPRQEVAMHVAVALPAAPSPNPSPGVWIALADDSDQSSVSRGENSGRTIAHVAVVRSLIKVGELDRAGAFSADVKVGAANATLRNLRIVAFVQESSGRRVLAVGTGRLPN